ncbi:hypothetical protein BT63DRAFT_451905 [Microthyrium microscopicum]|uniref:Uncharacterized protein n=1 Tax=Microthyrium microscopicum TaxID=703497 RepID=A0A6A6UPZ2_9PEZI|nr:hypothetical protein BT63DRAFT_451905 [Microthyrium microscopicum]
MDPLSALSVSSSAIQIVDFSAKLVKRIHEIYTSETGEIKEYKQLRNEAENLKTVNQHLIKALNPEKLNRQLSEIELAAVSLSQECDAIGGELLAVLERVSIDIRIWHDKTYYHAKWQAMQKAIKALWMRKNIEHLKTRLDAANQRLSTSILVNLQQDLSTFSAQIVRDSNQQFSWGSAQPIRQWLETNTKDNQQWQKNILEAVNKSNEKLLYAIGSTQDETIPDWKDTLVAGNIMDRLLEALKFPEMPTRYQRVARAHAKTFEWIFSEPEPSVEHAWQSFRQWLQTGQDIYWITGKAGSGKSTLMKLIYNDPRTTEMLQLWRPNSHILTAAFFSWNSGTALQRSQIGLLRTLLHQALTARRKAVKQTMPNRWDAVSLARDFSASWSWSELLQAFRFVVEDESDDISYAFFIDGLDEFEGDKTDLLALLQNIESYPNVKLCVSSRPWVVFEDAFSLRPSLMMQYRTYKDIRLYAETNLLKHPGFKELKLAYPDNASQLTEQISSKASGVFLWVVLVVNSLKRGFTDGDRLSDIHDRLDHLPEQLEKLFSKILRSQEPEYYKQATRYLRLVRAAKTPPSLTLLSTADKEDGQQTFEYPPDSFSHAKLVYRANNMKRRLDSRCKGLLEIPLSRLTYSRSDKKTRKEEFDLAHTPVGYLHRTVKDFLEKPSVWAEIVSADPEYDPMSNLTRALIVHLREEIVGYGNAARLEANPLLVIRANMSLCLSHALEAGSSDTTYQTTLLDQLDKRASAVFSEMDVRLFHTDPYNMMWSDYDNKTLHWSCYGAGCEVKKATTFLDLAAKCNLVDYLKVKILELNLTEADRRVLCTRLLRSSVQTRSCCPDFEHVIPDKTSVEMVDLLLAYGAAPDPALQYIKARTYPQEREDDPIWKGIIKSLEKASEKCGSFNIPTRRRTWVSTRLRSWYCG